MLLGSRRATLLGTACLAVSAGCGARTGLDEARGEEASGAITCTADEDCAPFDPCRGRCLGSTCGLGDPIDCSDEDPCTSDRCEPDLGCVHEGPTPDQDQDGYRAPLPGYAPGETGACGDDCDDTNPRSFPGGIERCDGSDNDCNGVVDDNTTLVPDTAPEVRISGAEYGVAILGDLTYGDGMYAAVYTGQIGDYSAMFQGLDASGSSILEEQALVKGVGNDTFGNAIVWTGSVYGTAWEDRRDDNFEIYFNRLDVRGQKLGPDLRLAHGPYYSLRPDVLFDGQNFVVVWGDDRNLSFQVFGHLVSLEGDLVGEERQLTPVGVPAESPSIAQGTRGLGLVVNAGDTLEKQIEFRTLSPDLEVVGEPIVISQGSAVAPSITWFGDRYVVTWHEVYDSLPGGSIWGAAVDDAGPVVPPTPLTSEAEFARTSTVLSFGDRLLLIWAADYGDGYDLYGQLLSKDLTPHAAAFRITDEPAGTVQPVAAFGPDGDVGILFEDRRAGGWGVYFKRLRCVAKE